MSRMLWPLVSIQGRLPELPEASDRRAGGGSKVEVALASTHSLFERRGSQFTDACNAALPPQYTAINCDSICLQYGVASARI